VAVVSDAEREAIRRRVMEETPFWAESFGKIVNKQREVVPCAFKAGQLEFDAILERQRTAGKPMRAIALKARQVGISTATQAKLIHRCTLRERYNAVVVAHDRTTGGKLYRIAETLYSRLPDDPELKPGLGQHRRQRYLHFAGEGLWEKGEVFPDSSYEVDTAGEFQAGRGGTYSAVHASEVAFWDQIGVKLTALKNAVPKTPESLFVIESTANGYNEFKDLWDDAEAGRSNYAPFFWPWWKEEEYRLPFASDAERERFLVADPSNPYAEEETELVKHFGLEPEQLNWRREVIADECNGDTRTFHQEYPSTPEQAFISTGQKVFDPYRSAQLLVRVDLTDPKVPTLDKPGPKIGDLIAGSKAIHPARNGGTIEVPEKALWQPRVPGAVNASAPWRLWLPEDGSGELKRPSQYVIGVDVSGGKTLTTNDPDYHAIEVIDHETREQVGEYRSRIDPDLLAAEVLLAALFFNEAYVAVERTGSWGQPVLRILWLDFHYPHVYRSKKTGHSSERTEHRLGWDTNQRTKPLLIAGMAELLRTEEDGIASRALADEVRTYTRTEKGTTEAEPGRYDDLLMAYMISQQVAREQPMKTGAAVGALAAQRGFTAARSGLGSYDPRYARSPS
jgi:hypothetical protein